jgi:glycosyltransferase 2 family protein
VLKTKLLPVLKYLIFLAIGILLLYYAFRNTNLTQMLEDIKRADFFWVAVSLFFAFLAFVSRGLRWLIMLEPLGYKPNAINSVATVFFGYFANLAAPRIGEVARCTAFSKTDRIPLTTLFGTVLLERVIDLTLLVFFIVVVFFLEINKFGEFFLDVFGNKLSGVSHSFIVVIISLLALFLLALFLLRTFILNLAFLQKPKQIIREVFQGFTTIKKMKKKSLFIFHTLFIWLMYYLMTYVAFFCIKETSHLNMADGLFIMVVGGLGMVAPTNGGIGAYHAIVSLGFSVFGIVPAINPETGMESSNVGLLYATIVHTSQTLLVLFGGIISLLVIYFAKKKTIAANA